MTSVTKRPRRRDGWLYRIIHLEERALKIGITTDRWSTYTSYSNHTPRCSERLWLNGEAYYEDRIAAESAVKKLLKPHMIGGHNEWFDLRASDVGRWLDEQPGQIGMPLEAYRKALACTR